MKKTILYISYDGMLEPLGQSQVLSYQERLADEFDIHILSFEKSCDDLLRQEISQRFDGANLNWHPLNYHKRPAGISTAADILSGILKALIIVWKHKVDVIHARSYVPAVIAIFFKKVFGIKFIFDMRGFWADERVDGGLWKKESYIFKLSKWFESKFILNADHIISLTHAAVIEIKKFPYLADHSLNISVIPTCTDLDRFKLENSSNKLSNDSFVLGYVGSIGTWYNFDAVIDAFKELVIKQPKSKLLVVNQNENELIDSMLSAAGIGNKYFQITQATHHEIPALIHSMTAGIFFIKPLFSKQASAPTKLGEFLGCGIPCLSNRGIGDMTNILEGEGVGIAIKDFDQLSLQSGISQLLKLTTQPGIGERCSGVAKKYFSLDQGVADLRKIYLKFLGNGHD
jgi:glycosyltransferase involved in cell wall biosynthesis